MISFMSKVSKICVSKVLTGFFSFVFLLVWLAVSCPNTCLCAASLHNHSGSLNGSDEHEGWTPVDDKSDIVGSGNYYLVSDIDTQINDDSWILPSGTINLCLNGYTIKNDTDQDCSIITINAGTTLVLYDESSNTGKICHTNAGSNSARGVYISGGRLILNGGTISGNCSFYQGAGIYIDSGEFVMNAGVIENNAATGMAGLGGGVYVGPAGSFVMNGGSINNNQGGYMSDSNHTGGGIYVSGSFKMVGGTISGNNADNGQSDDVAINGSFIQTGGTIGTVYKYSNDCACQKVTFDSNGGSGTMYPQYVIANAVTTLTENVYTYDGYTFGGWDTQADGHGTRYVDKSVINISSDITLYACWNANPDSESQDSEPVIAHDFYDELRVKIAFAIEQGGYQTITWDKGNKLPYDVLKSLEDHPLITLVFSYTYMDKDYKVTIPGSVVETSPLIPWYGPMYLYGKYGFLIPSNVLNPQSTAINPQLPFVNGTYKVVANDTLSGIAVKLHTTVDYLVRVNNIADPDFIRVGQVLKY